jgi:hypothetical protein
MPIAYYGSRISENMTKTPEGYLICHNVPIARTGYQDYLASELGLRESGQVRVYRPEDEVFSARTKASFESKPVTDDHPNDARGVTPDNYSSLEKGHVRNVRRGSGEESDLLIADLVIRDQRLIDAIEGGKREVSCGYQCAYEEDGDRYLCRDITGNHVAVVQNGRAGPKVAIKDEAPAVKGKEKRSMSKPNKDTLRGRILAAFARDEESTPEEVSTVADMLEAPREEPQEGPPFEPKAEDEGEDPMAAALAKILEELGAIKAALSPQKADPMDALETELAADSSEEESVTIPAEQIDDEDIPEEEEEKAAANDSARALLKGLKPVLAAIQDPVQRKLAQDAAVKAIRARMPQTQPGTYGAVVGHVREKAKRMAEDKKDALDLEAVSRAYQAKNPHILKEAK